MNLIELERVAKRGELVDKRLNAPERRIVRPVGTSAPKLVVSDDGRRSASRIIKGV